MAPKGHRGAPGALRPHSRSSSTSKLGANLQFTQRDSKSSDKSSKKNGHGHDPHATRPSHFQRANSTSRVPSQAQLTNAFAKRGLAPAKANGGKSKGFTIAKSADDDDDDEWVSSESGAATPNREQESDSEDSAATIEGKSEMTSDRASTPQHQQSTADESLEDPQRSQTPIPHAETARPGDNGAVGEAPATNMGERAAPVSSTPIASTSRGSALPSIQTQLQSDQVSQQVDGRAQNQSYQPPNGHQPLKEARQDDAPSPSSSRPHFRLGGSRRASTRPPSMHSTSGRSETSLPLRPHPLIRGQSFGSIPQPPRPAPLAPLTVINDETRPITQKLDSPPSLSTSPSSVVSGLTSSSAEAANAHANRSRRSSISSVRSTNTLPVVSMTSPSGSGIRDNRDRTRTASTISSPSSSAALSSLTHLPSVTRPPSPQARSFFPPVNPYVNLEAIHPLLPPPYLNNHLTVLNRRTPLRESYDRVIRAKYGSK